MSKYFISMGMVWIFGIAAIVSAQAASINLIKNSGFENGWKYWDKGGHAKMTWEISNSVAHSGKHSLHVRNVSHLAPNIYGTISQKIKVKPDTKYVFSIWVKAENAHHIWFGGGRGWRLRKYCPHGSWDWKKFSVTYKTKSNEHSFVFRINFDGYVGDAWVDDIVAEKYSEQVKATGQTTEAKITDKVGIGSETKAQRLLKSYAAIDKKLWPLYVLIYRRCYYKHIPCEYDKLNFEVIKRFTDYGRADISYGKLKRAEYVLKFIQNLYKQTEERVKGYLAGTDKPFIVSRYQTSPIEIKGYSFVANTMFPASHRVLRRNILFVGYGHFEQVRRDIPVLQKFGTNIIQIEIGPNRGIINPPRNDSEEFYVDTRPIEDDIVHVLKEAEVNNIAVCLLLSPHYFPQWVMEKYPRLKNNNGFLKYNINEPIAKRVMEAYLRALIPLIKGYKSLQSLCLSNEPNFHNPGDGAYKKLWNEYLKKLYNNDISKLNAIYKSDFASFEDVPIANDRTKFGSAMYYDWVIFNSEQFADWHRWMKGIVKEIAPNIPVHAKIRLHCTFDPLIVKEGVDPELFSKFSDINGCDCSCYYEKDKKILPAYLNEMAVYDMVSSFKHVPIFNSEDHIINDGDRNDYNPARAKHVRMVLWQGAVHRRSASTIWLWERGGYELFQYRPDCVVAVGRTALDLNRLCEQIQALQNIKPKVAILYSNPAFVHSLDTYKKTLKLTYKALSLMGVAVGFISEKQIAAGKLQNYNTIFIPQTECIYPTTLKKLNNYIDNGGKVVIVTADKSHTLTSDEHKLPLDLVAQDYRKDIIARATLYSPNDYETLKKNIFDLMKQQNMINTVLIDTKTEKLVDGVEWRTTKCNGKTIIDIANYTKEPKTVKIVYDGATITNMKELISNKMINSEAITVPALTPILIECE